MPIHRMSSDRSSPPRRRRRSPTTISTWKILMATFMAASLSWTHAASATATAAYTEEQLEGMKDEELELLCSERGFEMVRDEVDEVTGEVYQLQHSDYVEGAKRCLAIEKEMNDLLDENPQLADELDEEIKRLAKEAERLENIKNEREAEVKRLQAELKAKLSPDGTPGDNSTLPPIIEKSRIQTKRPADSETEKIDLTLKTLTVDVARALWKQVESDMRRVFDLLFPSVRPIWNFAWENLRSMFEIAKAKHAARQASRRRPGEEKPNSSEEAETCKIDS